jgi:hypothetical protein
MKIRFKDVGRSKVNWTTEFDTDKPRDELEYEIIYDVFKVGGLISHGINISMNDEFCGNVYAGFRKVGTFAPEAA